MADQKYITRDTCLSIDSSCTKTEMKKKPNQFLHIQFDLIYDNLPLVIARVLKESTFRRLKIIVETYLVELQVRWHKSILYTRTIPWSIKFYFASLMLIVFDLLSIFLDLLLFWNEVCYRYIKHGIRLSVL